MAQRRQGDSARNSRRRSAAPAPSGAYSAYAVSTLARGSAVFDPGQGHNRFAGFLLGGVAAAALLTVSPRPARAAPDACTVVVAGAEITCLGDQSNGIASGVDFTADTYETLNVNSLTANIAPASGVSGIVFTHDDASITLNSDLGDFEIVTTGDDALGILAQSSGLPGSSFVTVDHQGNITTTGNASRAIAAISQYDDVSITSVGDLSTAGTGSDGIRALAYDGAAAVSSTGDIATQGDNAEGISVNGDDQVTVTSVGDISTQGAGAEGIRASSDGDVTVTSTGNITTTGQSAEGIDATSDSGQVMVTSIGDITTGGDDSHGIRAYSEDGNVAVTSTGNIATAGALSHGIEATTYFEGNVAVVSTGNIVTTGEEAFGIQARTYGFLSDSDVTITSTGNIMTTGAFADGIQASAAYGNVTVDSTGDITTQGAGAEGIRALTYYGAATVSSTGDIATQGNSAEGISVNSYYQATVTSVGNISTQGDGAEGIRASSDYNVTVTSTGNITTTGPSSEGIDATSDFGQVMVTSIGDITTIGVDSEGIRAYSEYGNVTVTSTGNITTTGDFSHAIDAEAYAGGDVTVMSAGNLTTAGVDADGIRASADYGAVTVESTGDIATQGINAQGISVNAFDQAAVTSEGNISTQGIGASGISVRGEYQATVTSLGDITTAGDNAQGIRASSDGMVSVDSTGTITTAGQGADGIDATSLTGQVDVTSIGDIATAGGFATGILARTGQGDVTVDSTGNITTTGDDSSAIYAVAYTSGNVTVRSVGDLTTTGTGANDALVAFASGNITVKSTGNIVSAGEGINAFSNGTGFVDIENIGNITVSGNHGIRAETFSGPLTITSTGDITTDGDNADGVRAIASAGPTIVTGTGDITTTGADSNGIFGFSDLQVTVDHSGSITTSGADSHGIYAVSEDNDVDVTVNAGAVIQGGSGTGAGVAIRHSTLSTVTNYGEISALSGLAVTSTGASDNSIINNFGTITGDVVLAGTTNVFYNQAGGLFNSGTTVNLGGFGGLGNSGTVSPGGLGTIVATTLTGGFAQYADGTLQVDIDGATATSDLLDISTGADVNGFVTVNALSLVQTAQTFTIVNTVNGVTDNGLTAVDTAAVDYELDFTNPNQVLLTATVDLLGAGAPGTPNQQAIAGNLDAILTGGGAGPDLGALITALAGLPDQASFLAALDQLSPEVYAALVQSGLLANLAFADGLMSCRMAGGYEMIGREGACSWLKVAGRITGRDPAFDSAGWEETTGGISGGVQVAVGEVARLGIAGAYERVDLKSGSTFDSDADRVHVGTVLKLDLDGFTLAASATGGYAWHDTKRDVPFLAATAESDQTAWWAGGHVRATYTMRTRSGFYLAPSVDGGVTYTRLDGFTETGAGGANLTVADAEETYINLSPALEIGHTTVTGGGTEIRPFVKVGFTQLFGEGRPTYSAAFTGAPAGVPGFQVASEFDKAYVDLWAGADVFVDSGLNMRVYYQGGFAQNTESHAAGLKAAWAF